MGEQALPALLGMLGDFGVELRVFKNYPYKGKKWTMILLREKDAKDEPNSLLKEVTENVKPKEDKKP